MDKSNTTKEAIIDAALKLFSEKGYLGATTREISREAGISEVTLFRYFPTKEKLLEAVMDTHSFLPTTKGLLAEILDMPYDEALQLISERMFDFYVDRKDWIRIMHMEVQRSSSSRLRAVYHGHMDDFYNTIADYFAIMQRRKVLKDFDPIYGAMALHGMVFSYFNQEEILQRKEYKVSDRHKALREFVRTFASGTQV
jgi:AcrR family transcriptional regulator